MGAQSRAAKGPTSTPDSFKSGQEPLLVDAARPRIEWPGASAPRSHRPGFKSQLGGPTAVWPWASQASGVRTSAGGCSEGQRRCISQWVQGLHQVSRKCCRCYFCFGVLGTSTKKALGTYTAGVAPICREPCKPTATVSPCSRNLQRGFDLALTRPGATPSPPRSSCALGVLALISGPCLQVSGLLSLCPQHPGVLLTDPLLCNQASVESVRAAVESLKDGGA